MLNLDPAKLLVIAVVAVILLGPDRLPEFARQVGGAWRTFNEFRHRMETDVRKSIPDLPSSHDIARLTRSPTALLDHFSNMDTDSNAVEARSEKPEAASGEASVHVETSGNFAASAADRIVSSSDSDASSSVASSPEDAAAAMPSSPPRLFGMSAASDPNLN